MDFNTLGASICGNEAPTFLGMFDFSTAPPLLFYAYIPIAVVSVIFASLVYGRAEKKPLRNVLLTVFLGFFVLWVLNVLVQWVASYHVVLMFAWQMTAVLEVGLFLTAAYFSYVFIRERDMPFAGKATLTAIALGVLAFIPTSLNVVAYDVLNCEGITGPLWKFIYGVLEPGIIVAIVLTGIDAMRTEHKGVHRRQIGLFTVSFAFFLATFYASNVYGEITRAYEFNLWGPVGMVVFFTIMAYLIVKFQTFEIKLIAAEALVWALIILIGSQFFFIVSDVNRILNALTFVAALIFGELLIRSVKREIRQKDELALLLKQRERLEYLITHKVKGAFTRTKFIFAEIVSGTFGPISDKLKDMSRQGLEFSDDGIGTVDQILNAANLKKGAMKYDKKPVNFRDIVQTAIDQKKGAIKKKGLALATNLTDGNYVINGDVFWLREVAFNLLDNAEKYTPTGTITVGLRSEGGQVHFWVKDTGPGITDEDKKVLFTEGGRGKDSTRVNADSTGYGLYTIKLVAEAHGGRVWADSVVGKGTGFFVELPLLKT